MGTAVVCRACLARKPGPNWSETYWIAPPGAAELTVVVEHEGGYARFGTLGLRALNKVSASALGRPYGQVFDVKLEPDEIRAVRGSA